MDTKLTLKLNKQVIEDAKKYAAANNRSLSRLIEAYLKSLVSRGNSKDEKEIKISPYVKSIQSGVSIAADLDHKSEYNSFLTNKHK